MKRASISLLVLFAIAASAGYAAAQEPAPKPETPAATSEERPKNAVELAIEEARSRGELVMGTCVEDCEEFDRVSDERLGRGRALQLPKPAYPALARAAKAQGEVRVQLLIDVDGRVIAASVLSGHPLLMAASVAAARDSVFSPTEFDGKPVKVVGVVKYNFVAQ